MSLCCQRRSGSISIPRTPFTCLRTSSLSPPSDSLNNQGIPGQTFYRDSDYRNNIDRLPAGPPRDEATMLAFTHAYHAVVSHLDDQVGRFADLLRDRGLLKNTVVFYLSDNGYHLGSHGLGNKITMHEESVRVPMFAFGAGIKPGQKTRALVSALDVYPTLIELAGAASPPQPLMGKSLLPLFKDPLPRIATPFSANASVWEASQAKAIAWHAATDGSSSSAMRMKSSSSTSRTILLNSPIAATIPRSLRCWTSSDDELAAWMKTIGDRTYFDKK